MKVKKYLLPAISYGFPALLLFVALYKILVALAFGDTPMPQIPPPGHFAAENRVRLTWRRGSHEGKFQVQVAVNGQFETPVFNQLTTKTSLVLPKLKPQTRYCWRVVAEENANTSCFTTSGAWVPY